MAKGVLLFGSEGFQRSLKEIFSQIPVRLESASKEQIVQTLARSQPFELAIFEDDPSLDAESRRSLVQVLKTAAGEAIVVSDRADKDLILDYASLGTDCILKPYNTRELIARLYAVLYRKTRVSCIGGGTGLFSLLLGLKTLPNVFLTSIVSMTDDGGSSGRLRASFGVLPPGDIRRSLVALSNAPHFMNEVLQYRFERAEELKGHSFGNLFLTALAEIRGSMAEAVRGLGDILNIQGLVLPATSTSAVLCAEFAGGEVVRGESKIDVAESRNPELHITKLWHEPQPVCDWNAFAAILNSDIVTIGPGDLFTSVVTNLVIPGLREALERTTAKKVYVCNLMTKPGETYGYDGFRHVEEIVKYLGGDFLDYILFSNTPVSPHAVAEYAKQRQSPVELRRIDKIRSLTRAEIIVADVGHETELVRHDSMKLRDEINGIIGRELANRKMHPK